MTSRFKVLTIGTFDLAHVSHIEFLRKCANLGDLVVGVNSDEFVKQFKKAPLMTLQERRHAIQLLGYPTVDNFSAGRELIERVKPDVLVVGSDWARKDYYKQIDVTQDWLDEWGIIVAYIPYRQTFPITSTELKRRMQDAIKT